MLADPFREENVPGNKRCSFHLGTLYLWARARNRPCHGVWPAGPIVESGKKDTPPAHPRQWHKRASGIFSIFPALPIAAERQRLASRFRNIRGCAYERQIPGPRRRAHRRGQCAVRHAADPRWIDRALRLLGEKIYVTADIDGLNPSIAPGVGTPEPGGLTFRQLTSLLRRACAERCVVAADIVEVRPMPHNHVTEFVAARLAYKIIAYTQQ